MASKEMEKIYQAMQELWPDCLIQNFNFTVEYGPRGQSMRIDFSLAPRMVKWETELWPDERRDEKDVTPRPKLLSGQSSS